MWLCFVSGISVQVYMPKHDLTITWMLFRDSLNHLFFFLILVACHKSVIIFILISSRNKLITEDVFRLNDCRFRYHSNIWKAKLVFFSKRYRLNHFRHWISLRTLKHWISIQKHSNTEFPLKDTQTLRFGGNFAYCPSVLWI